MRGEAGEERSLGTTEWFACGRTFDPGRPGVVRREAKLGRRVGGDPRRHGTHWLQALN